MVAQFVNQSRRLQLQAVRQALRRVPALLWEADARLTVLLSCLQAGQTIVPIAQLWVFKLIVDRLVAALRLPEHMRNSQAILWLIALEFLLAAVGLALREAMNVARAVLAERLTEHISTRILAHAQKLDLEVLERPDYYDRLRRAEESTFYRPSDLLVQLLNALQGVVTLVAVAFVLTRLQPFALPLLLLAAVPYAAVHSGAAVRFYALSTGQTPETRQARYLSQLLSTDASSKELRVFGLGSYFLDRYGRILARHERLIRDYAQARGLKSALTGLLPAAAYAAIFAYFGLQALSGHITVGDLTLYVGVAIRSQDVLQQTMFSLSGIVENSLFLDDYFGFLSIRPALLTGGEVKPPDPIRAGVRFDGVSYRYAGSDRDALADVDLELHTGETVAVVGENGAGKTTLVKLLARLYDPAAGTVSVDGQDLRELDPDAWRRHIAVIFQDFVQYYLTALENVGFGQVEAMNDELRITEAAEKGGADQVIAKLPRGYRTILGRWFDQGVQLSGGEWQKIALARAFMRDAPILVLDEPTASLDARSEYEVFQRFRALTRGRIVLLISHRFSTVRMADRIYVLESGRVVEEGTHDELLAREGRYAELFHLQAAGYR